MNDCLACSGCITSAESVLIEQMSVDKFVGLCKEGSGGRVAVMIAPQALVSLGKYYGLGVGQCLAMLDIFLKKHFDNCQGMHEMSQAIQIGH